MTFRGKELAPIWDTLYICSLLWNGFMTSMQHGEESRADPEDISGLCLGGDQARVPSGLVGEGLIRSLAGLVGGEKPSPVRAERIEGSSELGG
jgi:hypothetical protein